MKRDELLTLLGCPGGSGADFSFDHVTEDSRRARPGSLFVAVTGEHADGHAFAEAAAKQGASAVLGDRADVTELGGLPYIHYDAPRKAAGLIAHALAGNPSEAMGVIGVTGTNGKTSTTYLIQAILHAAGFKAARFGTLGYEVGGEVFTAHHTTPFGEELGEVFARARDAGMTHVTMEASSHALDQERVAGIRFTAAAFTNLTQDHLDYHHDMETYRAAKLKLFERVTCEGGCTAVNIEDPSAKYFVEASRVPCVTFGKDGACRAEGISLGMDRTRFALATPWGKKNVALRLLGRHNAMNALCAAAVCGGIGVPLDAVVAGLNALENVPGRFETVNAGQNFTVVVDYAHTDDGLKNVLEASRALCKKKIITLFGCGGDRDRGKRPKMGAVAKRLSDFVVLTSDNPRTEDPHRILLDAEVGLQREGGIKGDDYVVIEDRAEAIREAIGRAQAGDLVMIAGKGHEDYQILGTERIHFDDREVARQVLEEKRKSF
jgi:UDP-N-acetylmuramoyl-L-alanyl-D-glutamate--2,6-diaminopimelate ligase